MDSTGLSKLPTEVLQHILLYLPPEDLPNVQQVSRRFNELEQPVLWRHHCRTNFKYWDPTHKIEAKFSDDIAKVNWKGVFASRFQIDRYTIKMIDKILEKQHARIDKVKELLAHGYDVKDTLLEQMNVSDDAEDVLARRYYTKDIFGSLHRSMAIREWAKLMDGELVSLERALAAFDMFILENQEWDFNNVSARLDEIAKSIQAEVPDITHQSTRRKAIAIAEHLRNQDLTGLHDEGNYHNLENSFIGLALANPAHPSLPLISVAIYCAVAQRLGVDAHLCCYPLHVYAIILPPGDLDLDGESRQVDPVPQPMYMDPYRSESETPVEHLHAQLNTLGIAPGQHARLLEASPPIEVVQRCARNILDSILPSNLMPRLHRIAPEPPFPNPDAAEYGAYWALILLPSNNASETRGQRMYYLPFLSGQMEKHFRDVWLIESHILPLLRGSEEYKMLKDILRISRASEAMPKRPKKRSKPNQHKILHKVGQVFRHRRYHYQAIIIGWDAECEADEAWQRHMGVHHLSKGKYQSFYHVIVDDASTRYVAEENIAISTQPGVEQSLLRLAGRFFKRYEEQTNTFVSNIRDEYPED